MRLKPHVLSSFHSNLQMLLCLQNRMIELFKYGQPLFSHVFPIEIAIPYTHLYTSLSATSLYHILLAIPFGFL